MPIVEPSSVSTVCPITPVVPELSSTGFCSSALTNRLPRVN